MTNAEAEKKSVNRMGPHWTWRGPVASLEKQVDSEWRMGSFNSICLKTDGHFINGADYRQLD